MDSSKFLPIILASLLLTAAASYQYFNGKQINYSDAMTDTYKSVADIQSDLSVAAENLSATDFEKTSEGLLRTVNSAKEILLKANKNLNGLSVPDKFSEDNEKLLECIKLEYNLMNRWKESVALQNEYEAAENYKFADGRGTVTWKKYGKTTQIDEGTFVHGRHHGQFKHTFPISGRVEYSNWNHGVEIR